jgi:hypothetical protein
MISKAEERFLAEGESLRRLLRTRIVATTRLPLEDGRDVLIRKPSQPDEEQERVYALPGIDWKRAYPPRKTELRRERLCSATKSPVVE